MNFFFLLCLSFLVAGARGEPLLLAFSKNGRPSLPKDDQLILRFNRSRLQILQQKFGKKKVARSRKKNLATLTKQTRTSGTRVFLGRPSDSLVAHWFGRGPTAAEFNHAAAGELTNPLVSVSEVSGEIENQDLATDSSEGWFPPVPFLGWAQSSTTLPLPTKSLLDECNLAIRQVSARIMSRRVLRYRLRVGEGLDCYERVRDKALRWEFDSGDKGMRTVRTDYAATPTTRSIHPLQHTTSSADRTEGRGRKMVSWTKIGPFYVLSPVAVVFECINQRGKGRDGVGTLYTSCAYATQRGHWLSGEERVTVALRDSIDPARPSPVEVEIVSISTAAPCLMGRLAWPLIGRMQHRFFVEQLRSFQRWALDGAQANASSNFANIVASKGLVVVEFAI